MKKLSAHTKSIPLLTGLLSGMMLTTSAGMEPAARYANDLLPAGHPALSEKATAPFSREKILRTPVPSPVPCDWANTVHPRLGQAPAPGEYPRIFTARPEYPRLAKQLRDNPRAAVILRHLQKEFARLESSKHPAAGSLQALATGRLHDFKINHGENIAQYLALKSFLADLDGNRADAEKFARMAFDLTMLIEKNDTPKNDMYTPPALLARLPYIMMLDFSLNAMPPAQKEAVFHTLEKHYARILMQGMELPAAWRRWNHIPMRFPIALGHYLLEGRPGYDKNFDARSQEVLRDYLTFNFSPDGTSTEGLIYTQGHVPDALMLMEAVGRRGHGNFFAHPHYQAIPEWLTDTLSPNPRNRWITGGDTGSLAIPSWEMLEVMKYFAPDDRRLDWIFANAFEPDALRGFVSPYTLCRMGDFASDVKAPDARPLTRFDAERGILNARTAWNDPEAAHFRMEARTDTFFPSHDHADRGHFTLAANGRHWVVDGFRSTQSQHHAVFTIDGQGQGYFPTPAEWLLVKSAKEADLGVVNTKYCYDYMWLKSPAADKMLGIAQPRKWAFYEEVAAKMARYYPGQRPERDPLAKVARHYSGKLDGDPRYWGEDSWPMRLRHNPVRYAFRSAVFAKGQYPYVLIVDDLKKDDSERLYEMALPMLPDVELAASRSLAKVETNNPNAIGVYLISDRRKNGDYELLLGTADMPRVSGDRPLIVGEGQSVGTFRPRKDNPMLLVRVLDHREAADPKLGVLPRLETLAKLKNDDSHQFYLRNNGIGKRLVVGTRATEADFKTLLYPHRQGAPVPRTQWNGDRTELTVEFPNQSDRYRFRKLPDGRTEVHMTRNNQTIF